MTELIVLAAFVPLVFLAFGLTRKIAPVWSWLAVALAFAAIGFFIYLRQQEPLVWIPAGALLSVFILDFAQDRKNRSLSAIAVAILAQALLSKSLENIVILIAFSDALIAADILLPSKGEDKNHAVQILNQSALSYLPAAAGILLRLDGDALCGCVAATIALRMFSWPVKHWISEINKNNHLYHLYATVISGFALWHVLTPLHPELWAAIWLGLALVFSVGAKYHELYGALTLALFSISPLWGVAGAALWPLMAHNGYVFFVGALAAGFMGLMAGDATPKVLVQEACMALAGATGAAVGRVFAGVTIKKTKWYWETADVVLAGAWIGALSFFSPFPFIEPGPVGMTFAGAFIFVFVLGKFLAKNKPALFAPLKGLPAPKASADRRPYAFVAEKRGPDVRLPVTKFHTWIADAIESEAYVILLLGAIGAIFIWRLK